MQVILTEEEYAELLRRPEPGEFERVKGHLCHSSRMWCEAAGGSCKHMNQNGTGDYPECPAKGDCPKCKELEAEKG